MANDYFNNSTALTRFTSARAEVLSGVILQAIADGFELLPGKLPLQQDRVTYVVDTGAANAYVVTLSPAVASYVAGLRLSVKIANTNTGASTINANGIGAKAIKRPTGANPSAGDILAGAIVDLRYDGTNFQIVGYAGADILAAAASATAAAASASAAASSASGASTSASAAAASASSASTLAANAATAETNAETAETNAEVAQAAAEVAQAAAEAARATAETAETNAETAQAAAATSATNAATSATSAATSATNAAASATSASGSATTATTKATEASTSATNAAASEAAAAQSAIDAAGAVGGVKVSSNDTTPGDLETKILAGSGVIATTQNDGGAETRTFAVDPDLALDSLTVSGLTTIAQAGENAEGNAANATGDVILQATGAPVLRPTLTGDVTLLVAGAPTPGHGWSTELRTTQDGTGGWDMTILPACLLVSTDDFSAWSASSGNTVDTDAEVAPDGTTTADTITWTTTADTRRQQVTVADDSASYTAVCFFKEEAGAYAALQLAFLGGTSKDSYARVNLETGVVVAGGGGAGTATVTSVAAENGYWKVRITNSNNSLGNTSCRVSVQKTNSSWTQITGALTVWRGNLFAGASELGTQKVGATRAGMVTWRTAADEIDYAAQAAAAESRIIIGVGSDGEILIDDVSLEA